jgi:hypothetical protein
MDIDLRWCGDPSIILGVEAALVASIPIQVGGSMTLTNNQILLTFLHPFGSFCSREYLSE